MIISREAVMLGFVSRSARLCVAASVMLLSATTAMAQSRAYVLSDGKGSLLGASSAEVVVIDTATGNQIAHVGLGPSSSSFERDMVFRSDGSIGYVSDGADVAVLDPATLTIAARFTAGANPGRLLLSADGARLFVNNTGARAISVVNTVTRTVTATITLPEPAIEMTLSPDGTRLYALAPSHLASVFVVNLASMTVSSTIPTEATPLHLGVHPDGSKLYVTHGSNVFLGALPASAPWLTAIDTQTFLPAGRVDLPNISPPLLATLHNQIDRPVLLPDGSRLLVPEWVKGWRTSPTAFVDHELLNVIDPATMTLVTSIALPKTAGGRDGRVLATIPAAGPPAFVMGAWNSALFDSSSNTLQQLGPGVYFARALAVVPTPPCAFSVWPQDRYVRTNADTVVIDVPAPAGCSWSAPMTSDWLTMTSPPHGFGPGAITLVPTVSSTLKRSTLSIAGQVVSIQSVLSGLVIDSLAEGSTVSPPQILNGWAVDRTVLQQNGSPAIELRDGSNLLNPWHWDRPDIGALYGDAYRSSGFRVPLGRLSVGPHAFRATATSKLDGTVTTAVVNVTVVRRPVVKLDLPAGGSRVTQPFGVSGWAVDGTAPTGVGIDAVQIWAHPTNGAPPRFIGDAPFGTARPDANSFMDPGTTEWTNSGYALMVGGLPPGDYIIRVLARGTVTGAYDSMAEAPVTVAGGAQAPIGSFDTPAGGAFGLAGSIAVTGWALDDVAVDRVEIWRDRMINETTPPYNGGGLGQGKIFIGTVQFVSGARPDIEAIYPTWPNAARAGWGYLLLTHGLWNQGNGFYVLHVFAYDQEGNGTVLGSKGISVDNATSTKPFGSIDTPGIGATVSGGTWNFGWALTPNATPPCSIGPAGVQVAFDSGPLQPVSYGDPRPDIAAAFPGYSNGAGAGGAYYIDTTTLSNGAHTIGWLVTDNCGRAEGIGSRFFTVSNGSSLAPLSAMPTVTAADAIRHAIDEPVVVRRGLDAVPVEAGSSGEHVVTLAQDERVEVQLPAIGDAHYAGYQIVNGARRALPQGSSFDAENGVFYWQPVAGFLGAFHFEFVPSSGGVVRVRAVIGESVQAVIDTPQVGATARTFTIAGWAIDLAAGGGTGIDTVHVWAYPVGGGAPIFIGVASYGDARADIRAIFGDQFAGAAYSITAALPAGAYELVVYPHSFVTGDFRGARVIRITVQ
jgi:YVTN family beta-propeller protein